MYIVVWKGYIYQWKVRILDHVAQILCFRICLFIILFTLLPCLPQGYGKFRANF